MKDLRAQRQSRPGLAESIRSGLAVPILSDEALLDLALPGHAALAQAYADYTGDTLDDRENLPRMARFYKLQRQRQAQAEGQDFTASDLRADFFDFVKNFIYAHAKAAGADADLLAEAAAWAAGHPAESDEAEQQFLEGCRQAQQSLERERRDSRRIRVLAMMAGIVAVGALWIAFLALHNIREAIQLCLEVRREQGLPLTR